MISLMGCIMEVFFGLAPVSESYRILLMQHGLQNSAIVKRSSL